MKYAIANIPLIPLRKEPDDRSEMVSQVLFGEHFGILETKENWAKIVLVNDGYEGWIDVKGYEEISEIDFEIFKTSEFQLTAGLFSLVYNNTEKYYLPFGSYLPKLENNKFQIGKSVFNYDLTASPFEFDPILFEKTVRLFLNAPYLWGGKSILGIDCSGFTQLVFAQFGIQLFRDANQQATQGELVNFIFEVKLADLAFFENVDGKITHVGIVLSDNTIIHAHGKVRIDALDDTGIFNREIGKYTHKLRIIKRFFNLKST